MRSFGEIWQSTIFQKWVMAVTGILLVLFLIAHVSGNLLIFVGPEAMNSYALGLKELLHGAGIWIARLGLIAMFGLHIRAGIILSARNRASKGIRNAKFEPRASSLASRTMIYSGLLIVAYVLYHLAHFTWGAVHSEFYSYVDDMGRHDVYRMVVESFRQPSIVVAYVVAMVVTGLHLNHAIASAFQTLGVSHPRYTPLIRMIGPILGAALALGFMSVPLAVLAGWVGG